MSDKPDNNPPAFPAVYHDHLGMRLRDWFAGQVLTDLPSASRTLVMNEKKLTTAEDFARTAYAIADAMLIERTKEPTP